MKTKGLFMAMAFIAFIGMVTATAQNTNDNASKKRITREELVEKRIQRMQCQLKMDDATTAKFTPLYKEYLRELGNCHKTAGVSFDRKKVCTDSERINRMEKRFECRQKMLDTQKEYFGKFKKILNAQQLETLFSNHGKADAFKKYRKFNHRQGNQAACNRNGFHHNNQCKR